MNSVLIVCLDAKLRSLAFGVASELGFRVDAVADQASMEKRLAKDRYLSILMEQGVLSDHVAPAECKVLEIDTDSDADTLRALLVSIQPQSDLPSD